ncbi:MAG: hypothetical protein LBK66_01030 [Spirochaetaceae bacterium]|nr:hypothetical protein [Spirochaetaceae bacterium]
MKRSITLIVFAVLGGTFIFGEDARLPAVKTGRSTTSFGISFLPQMWDDGGDKEDIPKAHVITAGERIEYSFTGCLSGVFDWFPGENVLSSTEDSKSPAANGSHDPALGVRFQIIGLNAPVKQERFRLTVAPQVIFPFPSINLPFWKVGMDDKRGNNAWGFGGGVSFDTDLTKQFFLNFHGEFFSYPIENEAKVKHGWGAAFEIEPHFETHFTGGTGLRIGLPVRFAFAPEKKINGLGNGLDSYFLSASPMAAVYFDNIIPARFSGGEPSPLELSLQYSLPVLGKNTAALHAVTLGITTFF